MLYQNQVQQPSVTFHQPFVASARPLIAQQPVEQQRPYTFAENNNPSHVGSAAETSIPPSPFEEPDDRKLLGQWYAQPATPKPDKRPPSKTSESVAPVTSPPSKTSESVLPVISDVQQGHQGLNAEAVETVSSVAVNTTVRPPLLDPGLERPESPTAVMQAKIFELIKKGIPLSTFNDPSKATSDSAAVTRDVTIPVGLSSIINQAGTDTVTGLDKERQTTTSPPPLASVSRETDQEAALQEQQLNSDNDTKEGIRLIHSDEDIITTNKGGLQRPATEQTVTETQCPTMPISHPADFVISQSLANQLEIDKNIALSTLDMDIYSRSLSEERDKDCRTNASPAETSSYKPDSVKAVSTPQPNQNITKESENLHFPNKNPSNISSSGMESQTTETVSMMIPQTQPKTTEAVPTIKPQTQPNTTEVLPAVISQSQPKTTEAVPTIKPQTQSNTTRALPAVISQTQPKTTEAIPVNVKGVGKPKTSFGRKDNSKKLKVKFVQPFKKASGSESPSKKITMTWKKKMAAKALLAETALSAQDEPGPSVDSVAQVKFDNWSTHLSLSQSRKSARNY